MALRGPSAPLRLSCFCHAEHACQDGPPPRPHAFTACVRLPIRNVGKEILVARYFTRYHHLSDRPRSHVAVKVNEL